VRALAKYQDESGLWHTLVNDPTSYVEASATAGFAYGILKSVRKRYLSAEYEATGIKALKGVLANISDDGELKNVSFGTAMGPDLDFYRKIPLTSMPFGQALAILCLAEFRRAFI
jgi:unsaturated rhamnogalacturonyl hydrolase